MAKKTRRARKRRTTAENRAISSKVSTLEGEGLSTDRATAAAFRMFRERELVIPKVTGKTVALSALKIRQQQRQQKLARQGAALLRKYFQSLK
jgi:hypothetical protein